MKRLILYSFFLGLFFSVISCNKEKTCGKISEGLYQGWFKNNGAANPTYNSGLFLTVIDENNIIIGVTKDNDSSRPHLQRDGCDVKGTMGAMIGNSIKALDIVGEISRKKGHYIISGNYSYTEITSGLGNPNREIWEEKGTFEIESN